MVLVDRNILYSKCRKEFDAIEQRNSEPRKFGWQPTLIEPACRLHLFIVSTHWALGDLKPSDAAFGRPELSVIADGGQFPPLNKTDLKKAMLELQSLVREISFVGAVCLQASTIFESNDFFQFILIHDPHPWVDSEGLNHKQAPNHVQILCDKRSIDKRDRLVNLCQWSLHPTEL